MNTIVKTANHAVLSHTSRFNLFNLSLWRDRLSFSPKYVWGILILLVAFFLTAIAMTDVQAENRYLYANLQKLEQRRDALNMQWAQLLLEKNTLSAPARIQAMAEKRFGMVFPKEVQLIMIMRVKK